MWGDIMPPEHSLQSRCQDCFKLEGVAVEPVDAQGNEGGENCGSSSSSSSTGLGPPAVKKQKVAAVKIEDSCTGD